MDFAQFLVRASALKTFYSNQFKINCANQYLNDEWVYKNFWNHANSNTTTSYARNMWIIMIRLLCVYLHCSTCSSHFVFESQPWKYLKTLKHWNIENFGYWVRTFKINQFVPNLNPFLLIVCWFKENSQKIALNGFCVRAFWYKYHPVSIYFQQYCSEPNRRRQHWWKDERTSWWKTKYKLFLLSYF